MTVVPPGVAPDMIGVEPRVGDFVAFQTTGWAARAIEVGTLSEFNHAAICDGQGNVIEANPGGVERTPLRHYDGDNYLLSTGYISLHDVLRGTVLHQAESLLGKPYDFEAIGYLAARSRHLLPAALTDEWGKRIAAHGSDDVTRKLRKTICSTLVAHCWMAAGIDLIPAKRPWQVTPGDLAALLTHGRISTDY